VVLFVIAGSFVYQDMLFFNGTVDYQFSRAVTPLLFSSEKCDKVFAVSLYKIFKLLIRGNDGLTFYRTSFYHEIKISDVVYSTKIKHQTFGNDSQHFYGILITGFSGKKGCFISFRNGFVMGECCHRFDKKTCILNGFLRD